MNEQQKDTLTNVVLAKGLSQKYINVRRLLRDIENIEDATAPHNDNTAIAQLLKATTQSNPKQDQKITDLEVSLGRLIKVVNKMAAKP